MEPGVRVAVLDSGIDYLHADLGGSGDPAEYAANDPTIIEPGSFPTAKVVGGYDFVGNGWPTTPLAPDPDPLDDGPEGGHGTHVGDIIAGSLGVAPGASLYAVKVCSSVSTSCSGIALIQGMEFAIDPNGDFDPEDHVDIINMSLGSNYGQTFDDDLAYAVEVATSFGVLTVASAGNGGNLPYIVGTPSSATSALSVAQTNVPSAFQPFLTVDSTDYLSVFQSWSPYPTAVITAPMQYGDGAGGNLNGCAAFAPGSLTGMIVLVDRGVCNFTLKIKNVGDAGGSAGIIGLIAAGDPFVGGDGGDRPIVAPGYMVSQAVSNTFKAMIAAGETIMTIDPDNGLPLVGAMVGSSSRGPRNQDSWIKPEIGAPGASLSAEYGTGTERTTFSGTSGAAPMVSGAAALLMQAYPDLIPAEVKARLMNNGETEIYTTNSEVADLAPITRIGGGEVRADTAYMAPAAAWDDEYLTGSLSFGFHDVDKETVNLFKTVRVRNYSDENITYNIMPTFRFQDDVDTGAVEVSAPKSVFVKAGKDATFTVKMTIHGALLRGNYMNGGSLGAIPAGLDINEYDGYLLLDDGEHPIHVAWHVLPRKAANTTIRPGLKFQDGMGRLDVVNRGVGTSQVDVYSLLATSENLPEGGMGMQSPVVDLRAVGIQTYPVPAGFCLDTPSFVWEFSINTWERLTLAYPAEFDLYLDVGQDGVDDYVVFNANLGFSTTNATQVTYVADLTTGLASAWFYVTNATNTANTVLTICGDQIGLDASDFFTTPVGINVYAFDAYFTGSLTDAIEGLAAYPLGERYWAVTSDVPGKTKAIFPTYDFGEGLNEDMGLLFFTNSPRGTGNQGGATPGTEAVIVYPQP
jgi:minor extracellular serine protease Vpr